MTTTTVAAERTVGRTRRGARVGRRSGEALVFTVATAAGLVHALDDAFLHRQPGVGLGQHALAVVVSVVAGVGAVYVFPTLRPALRSAIALLFGALALVNGVMHVKHIADLGAAASDLTGVLAAAAGAVLIGLAIAIPWLHRGEGAAGPRRRWTYRVLAVPVGLIVVLYTVVPMSIGLTETHKFREAIGPPPGPEYREVSFEATDGVKISAWYRPTRNGATILVVHGGGGDRSGALAHAKLLARHGYGVLLHDARGRGKSEGTQNAWGWGWAKDIAGALAFLKRQDGVDPERIGALGLSTGADVLIEVAAERDDVKALVADGAAAESFEDGQHLNGVSAATPPAWLMFTTIRVLSGDTPGPPLEDLIARVRTPTLLISAGTAIERDFNVLYDQASRGPVEHWNLPDAHHTDAIRNRPADYERRVVAFFDQALR
jgi:uncharacterized protein